MLSGMRIEIGLSLPMVELVVNSAISESTGMSLAYVMFCERLRMPVDCLDGIHSV